MKRNDTVRRRRVSGFTLLEMVIVMGIISILLGVLVPTMRAYMTKSRQNTSNSNAKVIFNSLQTIMQEYEFTERSQQISMFYGSAPAGSTHGGNIMLYCHDGNISFDKCVFHNKTGGNPSDNTVTGDLLGANYSSAGARTLGAKMGRLFTDYQTVTWCALIQDYSVVGVLSATSENAPYIGGYPLAIQDRKINLGTLTASNMTDVDFDKMASYAQLAWGEAKIYGSGEGGEGGGGDTPGEGG